MQKEGGLTDRKRVREGFPHQRLVVLPANVLKRCADLPGVAQLHVTDIGCFPSAPHHYVERKTGIPHAILIYSLEGYGVLELAGSEFIIEPGHAVIIPPGEAHTYRARMANPWSIFWIHFNGSLTPKMLENLNVGVGKPHIYVPDIPMMRLAFEDVYSCLNYNYSDAGLLAMTSELMRLISKIKLHCSNRQKERKAQEDRIMTTIEFMEQHLDVSVSLKQLASLAAQSVPHYCKLFKQRTNQTPMAYFIQLKVSKACELLHQTDQRIKRIAEQLGYSDPYHFSRLFKKIQGCSPLDYRRNIKSQIADNSDL